MGVRLVDSFGSGEGLVMGSREHGHGPSSGSIKGREVDCLSS